MQQGWKLAERDMLSMPELTESAQPYKVSLDNLLQPTVAIDYLKVIILLRLKMLFVTKPDIFYFNLYKIYL